MKSVRALALLAILITSASTQGSPEERSQILKTKVLKQLLSQGWALAQESQSQLIFERPMTGWGAPLVQAFTTGANGTNPVIRWTLTFVPVSDHYTNYYAQAAVTSQNAFGRPTTVPLNNPKNKAYIDSQMRAASESMPLKYKRQG